MARTNPAGESWAEWLNAQLEARGWRQVDLLKAMGDDAPARQTVNNWVKGIYAADADMAYLVGEILGEPSDAVQAAGCPRIAKALKRQSGPAVESPARPGPAEGLTEFAKGIRSIKARGLPPEREQWAIEDFTSRANKVVGLVDEVFRNEVPETRTAAARSA